MAILDADRVVTRLRSAFNHETDRTGLLQMAADRIRAAGPPYTSVYMYMLSGNDLILEAHSGRETEHTRIAVGHGVCGTAVAEKADQNVPDVRAIDNYIACNTWTRSELVVLIRRGDLILGQIDIDSKVQDSFPSKDQEAIEMVADKLAEVFMAERR